MNYLWLPWKQVITWSYAVWRRNVLIYWYFTCSFVTLNFFITLFFYFLRYICLIMLVEFIYVICRPGGPYWEKLCPGSWIRPEGRWPRAVLKTEGTFFSNTDRPRSANNVLICFSLENYFIRDICVDLLLKQFHSVRVRLTFRSSKPVLFTEVFKRRDLVRF